MSEQQIHSLQQRKPEIRQSASLTVADLRDRPSADPSKVVHELSVSDAAGGKWSGRVAFSDVRDGRDTPEQIARALLELVGDRGGTPTEVLAALDEPVVLFENEQPRVAAPATIDPRSVTPNANLPEPADGREPGEATESPLEEALDTYHLPRVVPFPVKLVIYFVLIGIPVPVLWWLVLPHTIAIVVLLALLELAIVFGGLYRIFLSAELTRLPRRQPVQAPSTKGLERPSSRR